MEEIWSSLNVKNLTVIDFGVGESTKTLVKLGANVIAVDSDAEKLRKHRGLGASLIRCDVAHLPFSHRIADLAVFNFFLHEVDPRVHKRVISAAQEISARITVIEPSPKGCTAHKRFEELWRRAMHSIGKFEDYQPVSYWKKLTRNCGFEIVVSKRIRPSSDVADNELDGLRQKVVEEWPKSSVESKYVEEMKEFLELAKKNGMKWSDLIVIVGESGQVHR